MSQKYFGMSGMSGKGFSYYHVSLNTLSLVTETFLEEETEITRKNNVGDILAGRCLRKSPHILFA